MKALRALKLSFTIIRGLHSNFAEYEYLFEFNFSNIFAHLLIL